MFRQPQRDWNYAYQNLQSKLAQIVDYSGRVGHIVPDHMKLSPKIVLQTTPQELNGCIVSVEAFKQELQHDELHKNRFDLKVALMMTERFDADLRHFAEDFAKYVGDAHHYSE